jgi:hypothetical protein
MMKAVGFALAGVALATGAAAEEPKQAEDAASAAAEAKEDTEKAPSYGHRGQFGLRAGLVGGYRMIFRYDEFESPLCNDYDPKKSLKDQQKFCGHGAPLAAEVGLSYALADSFEPFVWGRFGLTGEDKTDTDPLVILGLGVRIYTMSDSAFKIFIEPAIGSELEGGSRRAVPDAQYKPDHKKDIVFHLAAGPQYDFSENIGAFLDAGLTTGILRGIHSTLELQLGVQFRAP